MKKSKLEIGQTLYLKPLNNMARRSNEIIEAKVIQVGKKYFSVSPGYLNRFSLDNMLQDCGQWPSEYKAYLSKQEILDEKERDELFNDLIQNYFGIYSRKKISLETLRKVYALLNSDQNLEVSDTTGDDSSNTDD